MFLLRFHNKTDGKCYFYHGRGSFVGGTTREQAEYASINNSAVAVSVGGFDIVEHTTEQLAEMIGTTVENSSFKILAFHGGLIPFEGVEIVKEVFPK